MRSAYQAENAANELLPAVVWMQYPSCRIGGSGQFQLPLSGSIRPLTVSVFPEAKLLLSPRNSREVVSKQVAPVPRFPDWKLLPSATVNRDRVVAEARARRRLLRLAVRTGRARSR